MYGSESVLSCWCHCPFWAWTADSGKLLLVLQSRTAPGQRWDVPAILWWADTPELEQSSLLGSISYLEELKLGGCQGLRIDAVDPENVFRGCVVAVRWHRGRPRDVLSV
ncbi:unnamed protein product [Clonostachys rhizophaga]|uniref:Uncharacterized protein n=1 Tax=Clonostachys rhizophaga TaxID=160324 RepID=A0A9N9VMM7_9HYPO|nr:unnamed protein product [Clonostachys rhizophaga]